MMNLENMSRLYGTKAMVLLSANIVGMSSPDDGWMRT